MPLVYVRTSQSRVERHLSTEHGEAIIITIIIIIRSDQTRSDQVRPWCPFLPLWAPAYHQLRHAFYLLCCAYAAVHIALGSVLCTRQVFTLSPSKLVEVEGGGPANGADDINRSIRELSLSPCCSPLARRDRSSCLRLTSLTLRTPSPRLSASALGRRRAVI